jgi:glycosyltransferase involved in cell wall biosynthesis
MIVSARWQDGHLRGFSSVHPWTYSHLKVPSHLQDWPVFVFGDMILSSAPHFFYQDLNYQTILNDRLAGKKTYMYDHVPLGILKAQVRVQHEHYAQVSQVFAMSQWTKDAILATGAIDSARVHVVGAGSNLGRTCRQNPYTEKNLDAKTLIFVGRDFVRKGGPLLLEAWSHVHRMMPTARLQLVGPGAEWTRPQMNVTAVGDVDGEYVVSLLKQSTGFVMPTQWEPYGIAFLEAFSCGLPAIGPARMAIPEFLHDGLNGYIYSKDDPLTLADSMLRLLSNDDATWALSRQAFLDSRNYTWERTFEKMSRVLEVPGDSSMWFA